MTHPRMAMRQHNPNARYDASNAAVHTGLLAAAAIQSRTEAGASSGGSGGSFSQHSVKIICVLLLIGCALITITGRGVLAIVQGILGIMFAVEGFWGAVQKELPIVRKFMWFLVFYVFASVVIGVMNLRTVNDYCTTADPLVCAVVYQNTDNSDCAASDVATCRSTATLYAYLNLFGGVLIVPIMLLFVRAFYRDLRYQQQQNESAAANHAVGGAAAGTTSTAAAAGGVSSFANTSGGGFGGGGSATAAANPPRLTTATRV